MATPDEDAAVLDERSLRHLLSRPRLADLLWKPDIRRMVNDCFEDMYGVRIAAAIKRNTSQQYVITAFREIRAELLRLDEGKHRLYPGNVFKVVRRLESVTLDDEAQYLRVQIAVTSGLHHLLQSTNLQKDWPEVRKMIKSGDDTNESERASEYRVKSTLFLKKCARLAQSKNKESMQEKVRKYQREWPITTLISDLSEYCENATAKLHTFNSDVHDGEDHVSIGSTGFSDDRKKRGRDVGAEREHSEPVIERKRSRVIRNIRSAPSERNTATDSDDIIADAEEGGTSIGTPCYKTPSKRNGPSNSSEERDASAIDKLNDSVRKLREGIGKDPLEEAIAHSLTARRKDWTSITPSSKAESPVFKHTNDDDDDDDDSDSSDEEPTWKTPLKRVISVNVELDRTPITAGNTKSRLKAGHRLGFSKAEDDCLIKGLKKFGWGNWNAISKHGWPLTAKRDRTALLRRAKVLENAGKIKKEDYVPKFVVRRRAGTELVIPISELDSFENKCSGRNKKSARSTVKNDDEDFCDVDKSGLEADEQDAVGDTSNLRESKSRDSASAKTKRSERRKSTRNLKKTRLSFS